MPKRGLSALAAGLFRYGTHAFLWFDQTYG
jgi:hypothetical protein